MSGFPGVIYNAQGKSLDPAIPDLRPEQLDSYPHCSLVTDRDLAPVDRICLLADGATPDAIPPVIMSEAVKLVLASKAIVILARRLEPAADVRDGLLQALDLFSTTADTAGHA